MQAAGLQTRTRTRVSDMNDYWEDRAESYSTLNQEELSDFRKEAWQNLIFERIPEEEPLRVLDIGCGPGFFSILMAKAGHIVTGADLNASMLREARANAAANQVQIRLVQIGDTLPFAPESFDLILSRNVTWALTDPEHTLTDWFDKLIPGGRLLYFDAAWYHHLINADENTVYTKYKKLISDNDIFYYEKSPQMDQMAMGLPMTYQTRPEWDVMFWSQMEHAQVSLRKNLNARIYTPQEQIEYMLTPMFMIDVAKEVRK